MSIVSYEEVCKVVSIQLGISEIHPGDRLAEDLGAESFDFVNIVSALEERADVVLEDDTIARISTVGSLWQAFQEAGVVEKRDVGR